jgi:hypothetical protein
MSMRVLFTTAILIMACLENCMTPSTALSSDNAGDDSPALVRSLDIEAGETFVQLWPADGFLYVKEYHLGTLKSDPAEIHRQVAHISGLVRSGNYIKARYGLQGFTPMEERIFHDGEFVTVECRLLTKERNLQKIMDSVYSSVLNRHVAITVSKGEIGLHFDGPDIAVRGNNAKGVFGKDNRRAIFWRNGERFYEAVFARSGASEKDFKSITAYLEKDISSPAKSEAEIRAWKEAK